MKWTFLYSILQKSSCSYCTRDFGFGTFMHPFLTMSAYKKMHRLIFHWNIVRYRILKLKAFCSLYFQECQTLINLKNDICQLQHDLKLQLNRNDILERKKERLQQEIATHKEQRSFYLTERETILCERDQLAQSFEEIRKYNSELQQSRDEAVNKQLETSKLLGEFSFWYSIHLEIYLSLLDKWFLNLINVNSVEVHLVKCTAAMKVPSTPPLTLIYKINNHPTQIQLNNIVRFLARLISFIENCGSLNIKSFINKLSSFEVIHCLLLETLLEYPIQKHRSKFWPSFINLSSVLCVRK